MTGYGGYMVYVLLVHGILCLVLAWVFRFKDSLMPRYASWIALLGSLFGFGGVCTIIGFGPQVIRWYACNAGLVPAFIFISFIFSKYLLRAKDISQGQVCGIAAAALPAGLSVEYFQNSVVERMI